MPDEVMSPDQPDILTGAAADAALPDADTGIATVPTGPSWLEQDEVLRTLWMQNQTPQAISATLNRSVPAIMTRAARLGLPRRSAPGRKPGRRLLDQEHSREHGVPLQRAAPYQNEQRRVSTSARAPSTPTNESVATSLRICLMCLHRFESAGRHNRICPSCKGSAEYESASSLSNIHLPSG